MRIALWLLAFLLLPAALCAAETQAYSADIDGAPRQSEVSLYYANEAAYVPLFDLAKKLGGTARTIGGNQAEITLNGHMATISLNNVRYEVGGSGHDLKRPFLPYESDVLAPRDEAAAFFKQAFGLTLNEGPGKTPLPGEEKPAEPEMLETVPLAPPGEAPKPAEAVPGEEAGLLESEAIAAPEAKPEPKPGAPATIVIDPGHGGIDTGVQGASLAEKDLCLAIANLLAEALKKDGRYAVVLTRSEDKAASLAERVTLAKQQTGAYIVSIHAGGSLAKTAAGLDVFYTGDFSRSRVSGTKGRTAAEAIAKALESETGAKLRGVRRAPLTLLNQAGAPGCLVEVGYLTNAEEESRLNAPDYQQKIANGLARGLASLAEAN